MFPSSSAAEREAVNFQVGGSIPSWGAKQTVEPNTYGAVPERPKGTVC